MSRYLRMMLPGLLLLAASTLAVASSGHGDEVLRAVDARWNALRVASDVEALSELLLDEFVLTHSDGRVEYKDGYIDALRTSTRVNHAIDNFDVEIRRHGAAAIVTGRSLQHGTGEAGPFAGQFRFTRVWVLRDGAWRLAASHSSRLPAAAAN